MVIGHPFGIGGIVTARNLPQPGNAGPHHAVFFIHRAVLLNFVLHNGARPHKAHIADNHVEQLRQFIKADLAQNAAHAGYARIMLELVVFFPLRPQFRIVLQHFPEHHIGLVHHGAKLENPYLAPPVANTSLAIKYRALAV